MIKCTYFAPYLHNLFSSSDLISDVVWSHRKGSESRRPEVPVSILMYGPFLEAFSLPKLDLRLPMAMRPTC